MRKFLVKIFIYFFYGSLCYKKIATPQFIKFGEWFDPYTYWSKKNIVALASQLESSGNVLDVGSGGQWARCIFEKEGHKYLGCDIEESVSPDKQDFFVDGALLPLPKNSQDLIISNSVLEHIDTPELAVSEANRVLKKGGHFYCQTNFLYQEHGNPSDYYRFTLSGLQALMIRHNFSIVDAAKIGNFSTFIIDNVAAYLVNKMSNILLYFFSLSFVKRFVFLPLLMITIVVNNLISLISLIFFLSIKILGLIGVSKNLYYPGVYILCRKI